MRYIDSGGRSPETALGAWLAAELPRAAEFRVQSGFYGGGTLALLSESLTAMSSAEAHTWILVGSNDGVTDPESVRALLPLMRLPRPRAGLAVVSYATGYFHPKVYHIRRSDETSCAYVGSANLTPAGVSSLHVEAGIILDSREGDPLTTLEAIASAVQRWFEDPPEGFYPVVTEDDIDELLERGILSAPRPPASGGAASDRQGGQSARGPKLRPLFRLPSSPILDSGGEEGGGPVEVEVESESETGRESGTREDFPGYLLFAAGETTPTSEREALTGVNLPNGAVGLILALTQDSARHFFGGTGTSNISLPVATLGTIRFGEYHGRHVRPRAEFPMRFRYAGDQVVEGLGQTDTNVMAYGFAAGESGHGDVRMLVPAGVKAIATMLTERGRKIPSPGDPVTLEWPSLSEPEFRLTFLDPESRHSERLRARLADARTKGTVVGNSAAWLYERDTIPW